MIVSLTKLFLYRIMPVLVSGVMVTTAYAGQFAQATGKKLLEYTWGPPRPEFVMDNLAEMEKKPFDGVIMRPFFGSAHVFNIEAFAKHRNLIASQFEKYRPIRSDKLTDNFIAMYSVSNMDWFNDEDWKLVTEHVRLIAKAAREIGCVGVVFDPEPYGFSPWHHKRQIHAETKDFEEYSVKVRQRGREFIQAINAEFPDVKFLVLKSPYAQSYKISHHPDEKIRNEQLQNTTQYYYPLYLPFFVGILEGATDETKIINSTQESYANSTEEEFEHQYGVMAQGSKLYIPDNLHDKFERTNLIAHTVYIDALIGAGSNVYAPVARLLTQTERLQWLEYNVYHALKSADEYVWFYGEHVNWWRDTKAEMNPLREVMVKAILSAKRKLMNGEPIGFELDQRVQEARKEVERRKQSQVDKIEKQSAEIPQLKTALKLDGRLQDKVYGEGVWLSDFVSFAEDEKDPEAATRAWAGWDQDYLYLAIHCDEPNMDQQWVREKSIWLGESLDISILLPDENKLSPRSRYYHMIFSPSNERYEQVVEGKSATDTFFPFKWQSAVHRDDKGWYAEVAIPWKGLGYGEPESGMEIRINIARQRKAGEASELSSWSQYANSFQEPENLGIFILK